MRSWIYLLPAIGAEMIGTTSMELAATYAPVAGMLLVYGMISLSYFFLAPAVKRVPVGVAYALWEGTGIVLITAVSVIWLGEGIGLYKTVDLGVMIASILLIKSGTRNASGTPAQPRGETITC